MPGALTRHLVAPTDPAAYLSFGENPFGFYDYANGAPPTPPTPDVITGPPGGAHDPEGPQYAHIAAARPADRTSGGGQWNDDGMTFTAGTAGEMPEEGDSSYVPPQLQDSWPELYSALTGWDPGWYREDSNQQWGDPAWYREEPRFDMSGMTANMTPGKFGGALAGTALLGPGMGTMLGGWAGNQLFPAKPKPAAGALAATSPTAAPTAAPLTTATHTQDDDVEMYDTGADAGQDLGGGRTATLDDLATDRRTHGDVLSQRIGDSTSNINDSIGRLLSAPAEPLDWRTTIDPTTGAPLADAFGRYGLPDNVGETAEGRGWAWGGGDTDRRDRDAAAHGPVMVEALGEPQGPEMPSWRDTAGMEDSRDYVRGDDGWFKDPDSETYYRARGGRVRGALAASR